MTSLFEKYRPNDWPDVVGQDEAIATLKRISPLGRAILLAGASGTGKPAEWGE